MTYCHRAACIVIGCLALGATVAADTITMRDGRRVDGRLVAVRDGVIEFEQSRGFFGHETVRIDRSEVRRIELDDSGDRDGSRDNDDDRSSGDRRPSGMRERTVSVEAARDWNDTGIDLRPGQTVYFEASGRVHWGPGRQDGPAGEGNSPFNAGRPMPNRSGGALIGRVGDGDTVFYIGDDRGPVRVRSSGRLYLGVNDDYRKDNTGSFRVTIYY